jgi:hypothetical protein
MRTAGVKHLVGLALSRLRPPHSEDVIDEVFELIEKNPEWRRTYDGLCTELGQTVVNNWGGFYISAATGGQSLRQVPAQRSTLIQSYSKLSPSHSAKPKKRKEAEARQLMADYFRQHKASMPPDIRASRELIIDLLVEGASAEEAFRLAGIKEK